MDATDRAVARQRRCLGSKLLLSRRPAPPPPPPTPGPTHPLPPILQPTRTSNSTLSRARPRTSKQGVALRTPRRRGRFSCPHHPPRPGPLWGRMQRPRRCLRQGPERDQGQSAFSLPVLLPHSTCPVGTVLHGSIELRSIRSASPLTSWCCVGTTNVHPCRMCVRRGRACGPSSRICLATRCRLVPSTLALAFWAV